MYNRNITFGSGVIVSPRSSSDYKITAMNRSLLYLSAFLIIWVIGTPPSAIAQNASNVGIELQAYPAGFILGVRGGIDLGSRQELNLRLGWNIARRGDFGEHDNERGGGAGFGLGYRYYLKDKLSGLFLGARTDLWLMDIDWTDRRPICPIVPPCTETDVKGSTDITVFQPTLEAGYNLLNSRSGWLLAPTVSFGYEINVRTEGEEVGEGAILLGGVNLGYRF